MGLFNSAAKAAREAFEQQQKRAIELFGEGDDVYHWVSGDHLQSKIDRGFSPFTHVGTKKAAADLFKQRELSLYRRDTKGGHGATLPLRFNRKKDILDVEKDIGDHSALGVMWQVAPHIYGNRESAMDGPVVKNVLDRVVDTMSTDDLLAVVNNLVWEGHVQRPNVAPGAMRNWLRQKLEDVDEVQGGGIVKRFARDADMSGRRELAHQLDKFNIGALQYTNFAEDPGSKSLMIVQPHDIRAKFAKFDRDEWLKKNPNIMAALPAVAGAGGLLALSKRERAEA